MSATVLVIGSGGREHAVAWKFAQSPHVSKVLVAPGNGGTAAAFTNVNVAADDLEGLVDLAEEHDVDLVFVGPEVPLVEGIVDLFDELGIPCFGPSGACAELEGSKAFSKAFMDRTGVPTARWKAFTTEADALSWLDVVDYPVVIKASGLAAGKGVILPETTAEAREAVSSMFEGAFGDAGHEVVIEERLLGEEASLLAFCDGTTYVVMPPAQDHKRVGDGDTGPNTGGMGAYAPAPVAAAQRDAYAQVAIAPILQAFAEDGTPFRGILYAGLMLTADGPRVLEYNVRFGDPETQVLVPLLASDLYEVAMACVEGTLADLDVQWHEGFAATVVAASEGYPGSYPKGRAITGVEAAEALEGVTVFHAGTRTGPDGLETSGGRVLAVTGRGATLRAALDAAYAGVYAIGFEGKHARSDIGWRALS